MPTTSDYLTQLAQDREDLVDNLEEKGITGLTGDETFTELVPEVLNISGGGGGDTDIYRATTLSGLNSIATAKDDDLGVVYNIIGSEIEEDTPFQVFSMPETVTLDTQMTDWIDYRIEPVEQSEDFMVDGGISFNENEFSLYVNIDDYQSGDSSYIDIRYSSDDGINYSIDSISGISSLTNIDLGTEVYIECYGEWNTDIAQFIITTSASFGGIYKYKNNTWSLADIGITTTADGILPNNQAYTNDGIITGIFGTVINDTFVTNMQAVVQSINTNSSSITDFIAFFKDKSDLYTLSMLPLIDTSSATLMSSMFYTSNLDKLDFSQYENFVTTNVTNMASMFAWSQNLGKLDISTFTSTNTRSFQDMFHGCNSLEYIDMRNLTFDSVTNYNNMFGNRNSGVPNDCEIIVKSSTEKTWINTNFSFLTNVKTVAELEAE